MIKKILSVFLAFVLTVSLMAFPADAATSGTFGNLSWSYNSNTCTLTITGTGEWPDYYENGIPPWRYYGSSCYPIDHVVVGEGITRNGSNAF